MPVWPHPLPPPAIDGYAIDGEDIVLRTQVDTGPMLTRPRARRPRPRVRAQWLLTIDELDLWMQWWETEARYGVEPYIWYEPTRGRPGRWQALGPERIEAVAPALRRLVLEMQALEEWWPGWLVSRGATVHIWDARWPGGLASGVDGSGHASYQDAVGTWYPRVGSAALAAPSDGRRPRLMGDERPDRVDFSPPQYMDAAIAVPLASWAIAVSVTITSGTPPDGRIVALLDGTAGSDHDPGPGVVLYSSDGTDVRVRGAGYQLDYDTSSQLGTIAIVAVGAGSSSELRIDDIVRATQTGLAVTGTSPGPVRVAAGKVDGSPARYGARAYHGLAIVHGYVPTGAERTMLSRWAMALSGRDPYA